MTDCVYMTDLQKTFAKGAKMKVETKPKVDHTPAELDEVSKRLLEAAVLIEKHGLAKLVCCDEDGRLCLRGALVVAGGQHRARMVTNWWTADSISREADARVRKSMGEEGHGDASAEWNNEEERTASEVVAKLRAVALGL